MWRTQSHQLPHVCKYKLRSKWAGWHTVAHVLNLCHAQRFIRWNSNEWDACRLFTQGPAGLGKSESGFRGLLCAAAWMLMLYIWFFLLVDMLVQPSLRWRTNWRWAKVRNNYCLRNYTCGLAFCSWQFGMLPVFTSLLDTEHTWNRKMMTSKRNLIFKQVPCKLCLLVVRGEEISYWILMILEFASPTVFAPQKWDHDASCTGHLSDFFEGAWWGMTLQSGATPAMPVCEMSCLKFFTLVEERSFHIHNARCIRMVLTFKNHSSQIQFHHTKMIQKPFKTIPSRIRIQKPFKNNSNMIQKPFHHKIRQIVQTPYKNLNKHLLKLLHHTKITQNQSTITKIMQKSVQRHPSHIPIQKSFHNRTKTC